MGMPVDMRGIHLQRWLGWRALVLETARHEYVGRKYMGYNYFGSRDCMP